jgi:hypothetical protein
MNIYIPKYEKSSIAPKVLTRLPSFLPSLSSFYVHKITGLYPLSFAPIEAKIMSSTKKLERERFIVTWSSLCRRLSALLRIYKREVLLVCEHESRVYSWRFL